MKSLQVSAQRITDTVQFQFVTASLSSTRQISLDDESAFWFGPSLQLELAILPIANAKQELGEFVVGPDFPAIMARVRQELIGAESCEFSWPMGEDWSIGHAELRKLCNLPEDSASSPAKTRSSVLEMSFLAGDGVPVEVVVDGTPAGLRTAVVSLPNTSGTERLSNSTAHAVWDQTKHELRVRIDLPSNSDRRLWVRIAQGESGSLLALDQPVDMADGSAVSTSKVPHEGALGELYIDLTDEPNALIGSSRYRARHRAAMLESMAADLERDAQIDQARQARLLASSIRHGLGEIVAKDLIGSAGPAPSSNSESVRPQWNKWWSIVVVAIVGLSAGFGWLVRGGDAESSSSILVPDTSSLSEIDSTSPPTSDEPASSANQVSPNDQSLIVYRPDSTRFFGNGNVNLAAYVVESRDGVATIEVQVYDQYERSLGESNATNQTELLATCEERVGSDTGSGGGIYAVDTHVVALVAQDAAAAGELLIGEIEANVAAEYVGVVSMTANIIEKCEVRRVSEQDSMIEIARSAFEAFQLEVPLNPEGATYIVLRLINNRNSSSSWTSNDFIVVRP